MHRNSLPLTVLTLFFASTSVCSAATLSFGPLGSYSAGTTFSVPVYVSAEGDESVNAIGASIVYPRDILRIVSISDSGLVNLWAEKPAFSAADGTASFQGIIYNPGFTATNGKIVTISFKALAAGSGQIEFKSPSILANDGAGTEILTAARPSSITITASKKADAPAPAPSKAAPAPAVPTEPVAPAPMPSPPAPVPVVVPIDPTPTPTPASSSLFWTIVAAFTLPGFIFLAGLVVWLMWPRIVHVSHIIARVLSARDQRLQEEMYVIHFALTEELKRLRQERSHRDLSMSERRIFMRFATLQERIEKIIGKNIRKQEDI